MCNCGKKRAAVVAPPGGPPRAVPVAVPAPVVRPVPVVNRSGVLRRSAPAPTPVVRSPPELPIVDPAIWGPHLWRFLHIAAEGTVTRVSRRRFWDALLTAMRTGLPCPECTEHYVAWLAGHPFVVDRRVGLTVAARDWVRGLHNAVNVRRGPSSLPEGSDAALSVGGVPEWSAAEVTAAYGSGGRAGARAALDAAAAAGVGSGVIAAGRALIDRAMT
jgi:hypothetical protein